MRIMSSALSAIDAVFGLIALVGVVIDIISNRRDKGTYIKLIFAVGAFILFSCCIIFKIFKIIKMSLE